MTLGHDTQYFARGRHDSAVVEHVVHRDGQADHECRVQFRRTPQQLRKGLFGSSQQRRLQEEIAAGIARY